MKSTPAVSVLSWCVGRTSDTPPVRIEAQVLTGSGSQNIWRWRVKIWTVEDPSKRKRVGRKKTLTKAKSVKGNSYSTIHQCICALYSGDQKNGDIHKRTFWWSSFIMVLFAWSPRPFRCQYESSILGKVMKCRNHQECV